MRLSFKMHLLMLENKMRGALSWSDLLGLHAVIDMDKPSVWGSLKQRTRPLLINLSKKRGKKNSNKPLDLRARRSLDRRLSLSVPDLLEAEALAPEGRPYCGPQSSYTSVPSSLSTAGIFPKSSSNSLKQSEDELDWSQEEAGHLHVVETDSEEAYASPTEDRRPSSNGILDPLQKTPVEEDTLEEPEIFVFMNAVIQSVLILRNLDAGLWDTRDSYEENHNCALFKEKLIDVVTMFTKK
ncbi:multiple C2 and transmembrane domain-containing protein 2-like [Leptonychotes weddellii]|uniref:Multiple C2 and transmembrane domain-containing protein 2-like n=1 Tax=Leptonychotes weddellii TaxID=9713 RepID=A0A7F8QBL0_LEPWE|nr:multiple C2 and transmembrane domain-containing protein 2-like [Leptonychotes weddellii]